MTADFGGERVDLAKEADFRLGAIRVRPSSRQVEVGGSSETIEPRIMQVLVALARRQGEVVSRDELMQVCWGGRIVGGDALNRCISKVRKLGEAADAFSLEAIPRVGYRLLLTKPDLDRPASGVDPAGGPVTPKHFDEPEGLASPRSAVVGADRPSLAVMPFAYRMELTRDDALAYGMVEDIISAISLSPDIRVLASSSTLAWADKATDPRVVGRDLGVRYLLEGNVRRASDNLRVTVRLVETETAAILWTQVFDRPLGELAALQEDLVIEVAGRLGVQVQNLEFERALRKPGDITAYEAVQRAQAAFVRLKLDRLPAAIADARRAVAIAPEYGAGHAALAGLLAIHLLWTGGENESARREILHHNERALVLAPNDPNILANSAITLNRLDQPREAILHAQLAVELNPNIAFCHAVLATVYLRVGRNDDAIAGFDIEERLAPGTWGLYVSSARRSLAHFQAGRMAPAVEAMERAYRLNSEFAPTLFLRAGLSAMIGRKRDARESVWRLRETEPGSSVDTHSARMLAWGEATQIAPLIAAFRTAWDETPAK